MFKKLFRYDMKYMGKIMLFIILGAVIISGACVLLNFLCTLNELLFGLSMIPSILVMYAVLILPVAALVIHFVRTYKNLYSDEGFLTYTLPVSVEKILLSKVLSGSVIYLITVFATLILFAVSFATLIFSVAKMSGIDIFSDIGKGFNFFGMHMSFTAIGIIIGIILTLILILLTSVYTSVTTVLSLSIGQLCGKWRIPAAIGVYFVIGNIASFIIGIPSTFISIIMATGRLNTLIGLNIILIISIIITALMAVLSWFITVWLNKKKLNLG